MQRFFCVYQENKTKQTIAREDTINSSENDQLLTISLNKNGSMLQTVLHMEISHMKIRKVIKQSH